MSTQSSQTRCLQRLRDQGGRGARLVLPGRGQHRRALVVPGKAVNAALDENEAELAVAVLPVALQVLAHANGLLDEVVQVLGQGSGETYTIPHG